MRKESLVRLTGAAIIATGLSFGSFLLPTVDRSPAVGFAEGDPAAKYGPGLRTVLARDSGLPFGRVGVVEGDTFVLVLRTRSDISPRLTELGVRVRSVVDRTIMTADVPAFLLVPVAQLTDVVSLDTPLDAGPAPAPPAQAALRPAEDPTAKYGPALRSLLAGDTASPVGQVGVNPATISVVIRTQTDITPRLIDLGARVRSVIGGAIVTADVPVGALPRIAEQPEVVAIDAPVAVGPAPVAGPGSRLFLPIVVRS